MTDFAAPSPSEKPPQPLLRREIKTPKRWAQFAFANTATRREAKAILFQELAVAVRNGMPLDEALENAMRSEGQRLNHVFQRRDGESLLIKWILAAFYFILAITGSFVLLLLMSTWASDVERVARVLSQRLLPLVRSGHSLADAMRMLPSDYTKEEAETIRVGEQWGNLPDALESLGRFQFYEREIQRHWSRMAYPLWLFLVLATLLQFIALFILPKFKDIYDQLGAQIPYPTQLLMDATAMVFQSGLLIITLLLSAVFIVLVLRMFMVGNRLLRNLAAAAFILSFAGLCFAAVAALHEAEVIVLSDLAVAITLFLSVVVGVTVGYYLLGLVETVVLAIERSAGGLFGSIPIVGAPRRTERESRWLGTIATGIASGVAPADAVEAAGRVCRGNMQSKSEAAATLIRKGHPLGQAVVETNVLREQYGHRLRMLDDRPAYVQGLIDISEDASRDSYHTLNRASRVAEVLSVVAIGVITGAFALAVYLPLFNIPQIVGTGY